MPVEKDKRKGPVIVLKEYFGYRPGDGLKEFTAEVRQLTDKEKLDLACPAAHAIGLRQDDVNFLLE